MDYAMKLPTRNSAMEHYIGTLGVANSEGFRRNVALQGKGKKRPSPGYRQFTVYFISSTRSILRGPPPSLPPPLPPKRDLL